VLDVVVPRTPDPRPLSLRVVRRAYPTAPVALLVVAAILVVALLVAACTAHSMISTGPDGFRTFAVVRNPDGSSVACAAFGLTNPVVGILDGQAGAREPVWLRAADGRHLSVVWPEGFTLRFEPDAAIYTDRGTLLGRVGDRIVFGQTGQGDAAGTFDDPYFASGLIFGGCYPVLQR
jgi:hypothetical protein